MVCLKGLWNWGVNIDYVLLWYSEVCTVRWFFLCFLLCATDFFGEFCRAKIRDGVAFCQISCWFSHISCCLSQHV